MKKVYFCIDYEEWYHIPYLKKYSFNKNDYPKFSKMISGFMDWLSQNQIVCNIFVVGELASDNAPFLKKCFSDGHLICCHSLSHLAINEMAKEEFVTDTKKAKDEIENAIGSEIFGYRAPFFSMTNEKLMLLKSLGFAFDSSYIQSNANEYYSTLDMSSFKKTESLVYEQNGFKEYEIPTIKNKPIAGGGFFRLYPFFLFKSFLKKHFKKEENYVFFIHPFEISGNVYFPGVKKMSLKDKIRFQLGRKNAQKKLKKVLLYFKKQGFKFSKFSA